jgi:organic radical activating enzyme
MNDQCFFLKIYILRSSHSSYIKNIVVTGGEPLMSKNIPDLREFIFSLNEDKNITFETTMLNLV